MTIEQVLTGHQPVVIPEHIPVAPESVGTQKTSSAYPAGLTEREVEVLRLVAQGLTNPQIAEQLIVSSHTVNAHIRSIFNKLEVNSRSAVTRFAVEHKLV
jgi:DNA-binding NarL/FixJ family response regulator